MRGAARVNVLQPKPRGSDKIKSILTTAMRKKFPHDTIDISDGYDGDIHVLVVSRAFDEMSNRARYSYLWKIVEGTNLTSAQKDLVTVVVGVSPREFM